MSDKYDDCFYNGESILQRAYSRCRKSHRMTKILENYTATMPGYQQGEWQAMYPEVPHTNYIWFSRFR